MNFKTKLETSKKGVSRGLPTGLKKLDRAIGGVHKKMMYGIAAAPKVGKTTFTDFSFVINPILHALEKNIPLYIIYFSYEIDRVTKEYDFASFFFDYDYNINTFEHKGKIYPISSRYLLSKLIDDDDEIIIIKEEHEKILLEIYEKRIIPIFGEFDENHKQIKNGIIKFFDTRDSPTGMKNTVESYAKAKGKFTYDTYKKDGVTYTKKDYKGYTPHNPDLFTIVVCDHIRKIREERNFTKKQTIDKWIEYCVDLRNICEFTFVQIIHLNRGLSNVERLKFNGEFVYPTGDDIKDTG